MNSLLRIMATGSFIAERMRTEGGTGIEGRVLELQLTGLGVEALLPTPGTGFGFDRRAK